MADRSIILEFIGIPGAGKSTLAAALAQRLSAHGDAELPDRLEYRRRELTIGEKLRLDALYAPSFLPYRMERLFHDVRKSGMRTRVVGRSWNQSRYPLVLLDRIVRVPRRFYILDEWLMHRTIDESIRRYQSSVDFSMKFAILPPTLHQLVYVCIDVTEDLACERVLAQNQPFRAFANTNDRGKIDEILSTWRRHLEALKVEIERRGFLRIDVDGSAAIESNVTMLQDRLGRLATARHEPSAQPMVQE